MKAIYSGDANYFANDSFSMAQFVTKATPTSVVITNSTVVQEFNTFPVQFNVQVTVPAAGPAPKGTVTISVLLGTQTYVIGSATGGLTGAGGVYNVTVQSFGPAINPRPAVPYSITATYSGDSNYLSQTGSGNLLVKKTVGPRVLIGPPTVGTIGSGPVSFIVTYLDPFLGAITLNHNDIALNVTGTVKADFAVGFGPTANTRIVTVDNAVGKGTITISIAAGSATDTFGNPAQAAGPSAPVIVDGFVKLAINFVNPPIGINRGTTTAFLIQAANLGNQIDRNTSSRRRCRPSPHSMPRPARRAGRWRRPASIV